MLIIDNWLNDLPQQFLGKKNIEALTDAFAKQLQELNHVFDDLVNITDVDTAFGSNLDMVGTIVGLTRKDAGLLDGIAVDEPVMQDERYRRYLKYKILRNTNECTYFDIMNSIELLWHTSNIEYREDPNRPATILIKIESVSIDDNDPTMGKTVAIKPAGVSLIYTVQYLVIVDNRFLEKIHVSNLRMYTSIRFWDCYVFDGSWFLDGEITFGEKMRYDLVLGLKYRQGEFINIEQIVSAWVRLAGRILTYNIAAIDMLYRFGIRFVQDRQKYAFGLKTNIDSDCETIGRITVVARNRDSWFFDGVYSLDGSKTLNSIYRKENVE